RASQRIPLDATAATVACARLPLSGIAAVQQVSNMYLGDAHQFCRIERGVQPNDSSACSIAGASEGGTNTGVESSSHEDAVWRKLPPVPIKNCLLCDIQI